jgi:hypothetical protein
MGRARRIRRAEARKRRTHPCTRTDATGPAGEWREPLPRLGDLDGPRCPLCGPVASLTSGWMSEDATFPEVLYCGRCGAPAAVLL